MIKAFSLTLSADARQRLTWMDMYRECDNAARVCRHFGIPLRTFWRWRKRYDPWDLKSLENQSRRPKQISRRIPWNIEQRVITLKRAHPRWGKEKLALYLRKEGIAISGKTCWRICKRHALIVRYRTRKRRSPKPRVNWANVRSPGDLAQMDTKYVSLHGRRLFQYTLVDVTSRWRYAEIHPASNMKTTIQFLKNVFADGLVPFKVVQTDNGHEFGRSVSSWLNRQKIRHVFSHKGRPVENAYVERSHRIDEEEFYSLGGNGSTVQELRENFSKYMTMYNTERPHWGLKGKTPQEALQDYLLTKPCHMS